MVRTEIRVAFYGKGPSTGSQGDLQIYSWLYISQALYYQCSIELEYRLLKKGNRLRRWSLLLSASQLKKKDNIEILNVFNLFNFNVFFIVKCCCVNQGSWLTQTLGSSSKVNLCP